MLVSEVRKPHRVVVVDCGGVVNRRLVGPGPLTLLGGEDWVTVSSVALADWTLQTISDLQSDRRTLALYDGDQQLVRTTEISIPMAFFGYDPTSERLLAVRDFGVSEVAEYTWRLVWEHGERKRSAW
jgi:hypothetical protein